MLTLVLYGVLAILLGGALFLLAAFLLPAGEQIAPAIRDEPPWELPASRRLGVADVADIRLPVALRGYRFAETDLLLDRLADELRERDDEIARLRGRPPGEPLAGEGEPTSPVTPDPARWPRSAPADQTLADQTEDLSGYAPPDRPQPDSSADVRPPAHSRAADTDRPDAPSADVPSPDDPSPTAPHDLDASIDLGTPREPAAPAEDRSETDD